MHHQDAHATAPPLPLNQDARALLCLEDDGCPNIPDFRPEVALGGSPFGDGLFEWEESPIGLENLSKGKMPLLDITPALFLLPSAGVAMVAPEQQPVFAAVDRIVQAWAPLFDPPLTGQVVFTIQPGRGRRLGWFYGDRWCRKDSNACLPEINLCADQLAGGLEQIANTVVHELTHYANWRLGVRDCSASQYHKRSFKEVAEPVGLVCGPWHKSKGWGYTALSADARARVEALGIDPAVFTLFRPRLGRRAGTARPPTMRTWHCGGSTDVCGPVWRAAGKKLQSFCQGCGGQFVATS
jgi:hypothetical protein